MRLLGLDQKMKQYEDGKRFCDAVVAEAGIETLNLVWHAPTALPTAAELRSPRPGSAASRPTRVAAA